MVGILLVNGKGCKRIHIAFQKVTFRIAKRDLLFCKTIGFAKALFGIGKGGVGACVCGAMNLKSGFICVALPCECEYMAKIFNFHVKLRNIRLIISVFGRKYVPLHHKVKKV